MQSCRAGEAYGLIKVMQPQQGSPQTPQSPAYGFIFHPPPARRGLFKLPGPSSTPLRLITVFSGILVLIIIFVIIKNVLSGGGPDFSAFIPVVQDQQELIHLS